MEDEGRDETSPGEPLALGYASRPMTPTDRASLVRRFEASATSYFLLVVLIWGPFGMVVSGVIENALTAYFGLPPGTGVFEHGVYLFFILITELLFCLDAARNSATYGMMKRGLVFVRNGRPLGFKQAFIRTILGHLLAPALPLWVGMALAQRDSRSFADKIMDTDVAMIRPQ